jgi:hypothetical protein
VKSTPQGHPRLEVAREFLDETTSDVRGHFHRMKVKLVFNLDEVGMSEWEDRKEKKIVVPMAIGGQTVYHSASRSVKYISVIVYLTAG